MARDMAPGEAYRSMFTNGTSSKEGGMTIAVPGEVKDIYEAWKLGGRLPCDVLFRPAIQMCTEGFPVGEYLDYEIKINAEAINRNAELKQVLTNKTTGELLKKGDILKLPKLAITLEKIANNPVTFYNDSLAEDIVQDIADAGGIISLKDLKAYGAAVKDPMMLDISGGYTVMSPPPPSNGVVLLFILNVLKGFHFNAASIATINDAVETYHRIIEAFKHGFAIRTNFGDADQEDQQFKDRMDELIKNMTSPCWGDMKRDKITRNTHDTAYYEPSYDLSVKGGGTTHISVLGPNGDAVSVTSSINIYRTGIFFNNVMDDFSTPNQTDFYGIPASAANIIRSLKRPLSSMSPTIVLDGDGDVKLVTGGTGGSNIITAVAMNIIQTLWLKLGLKEAIDFPRIHHQLLHPEVKIEQAIPEVILRGLAERGHIFDIREKLASTVQAIMRKNKQEHNTILNKLIRQELDKYSYSDPFRNGEPDSF